MNDTIVGLKEVRENMEIFISGVNKGKSYLVMRKSKPVFKIAPVDEDESSIWETMIDFTKIKKGGVALADLLSRL